MEFIDWFVFVVVEMVFCLIFGFVVFYVFIVGVWYGWYVLFVVNVGVVIGNSVYFLLFVFGLSVVLFVLYFLF